jgi:hypothetical protein
MKAMKMKKIMKIYEDLNKKVKHFIDKNGKKSLFNTI